MLVIEATERRLAFIYFCFTAVVAGLFFALAVPPFQVPDEPAHFFRALRVAYPPRERSSQCGAFVPSWGVVAATSLLDDIPGKPWVKTSRAEIARKFHDAEGASGMTFVPCGAPGVISRLRYTAANYTSIPYLIPAAALRIVRSVTSDLSTAFIAGRIANLAVTIVLLAIALRMLPRAQLASAAVALAPMTLHLAASYSADGLAIGASFLSIATFARMSSAERVSWREISILTIALTLVALSKPNLGVLAIAIVAPLSFIRKERRSAARLVLPALAVLFALAAAAPAARRTIMSTPTVDASRQLTLITMHPLGYVATIARTWLAYSPRYFNEFVGKFGWTDTVVPDWITSVYLIVVVFLAVRSNAMPRRSERTLLLSLFAICALVTLTTIYTTWSPVGSPLIDGVQGRYFIPFAPFLLLGSAGLIRSSRVRRDFAILVTANGALLAFSAWLMIDRYYG